MPSLQKCSGQMVMALAVMVGFMLALYFLVTHDIPVQNHDVIITLLGAFTLGFGNVINYYFGSSIGSRNKESTIEKMSTGPTVTETTTQGMGDNLTTKTTTTQPAGGTVPVAVNVQPPATVTVSAPAGTPLAGTP